MKGKDSDVSMTAFCLIAMQESRSICDVSISPAYFVFLWIFVQLYKTEMDSCLFFLTGPWGKYSQSSGLLGEASV